MALEQKLRLKLAQRLVMTPSLQQAIKLLQLSRLELEETLAQEILENPVLDVDDATDDPAGDGAEDRVSSEEQEHAAGETTSSDTATEDGPLPSAEETYEDIDVEAFFSDYLGDVRFEGPSMAIPSFEQDNRLENMVSSSGGLAEHLHWQLQMLDLRPEIVEVCEFIIGNLDEDGFLCATDEEIIRGTGCDQSCVTEALTVVRSLDPPGIAASSLQECLSAQVDHLILHSGENGDAQLLAIAHVVIGSYWEELLHQKWDALAEALELDEVGEIKPILDVIHGLEMKPGRIFRQDDNQYIEPDVYVRKIDEDYTITLNDDGLPKLRINSRYQRMLEGKNLDPKASEFLRDKMRSAMWLMKSIDQRQRTIYKVAQSIVSFQKGFLENGIEHLRPMVLRQVAEDIGMHESTISRVVSNMYMYTPRGLFPMKYFFHSGVDSAHGENVSSMVVKERIRKVVEAEDPARPLSDSKIMRMLQKEGIRLARRTVAKYREEMMIPSSDKRKKVF
ncbi:MAG: RNA polymerase factor sigma-54 [Acidobacteria bacterium]|nr:RNA polymerase factor sigma-54 [Acidobacteriota bacterium]